MHSSSRQGPPLGWPLARRLPQPTQPREAQCGWGQKCDDVSTWRGRPRVGTMRGGGQPGGWGTCSWACSQASQCGLVVRPAKGVGSRGRFGSGDVGSSVVGHVAAGSLGHAQWSMTHSHTRATSTNWEKKRSETMAKPPHTGAEMRVFYPVFRWRELALYQHSCYQPQSSYISLQA